MEAHSNAYELADELEKLYRFKCYEAAVMLREQQRTLDGDKRLIDLLYEKIDKQQSEIKELRSQLADSTLKKD